MVFQEPLRYTRITTHFFWNELLASVEADKNNIINAPITEAQTENIITTANYLETIRELLGNNPVIVSSCFRSPKVNKLVGGSLTSAHLDGLAVDFVCNGSGDPAKIVSILRKHVNVLKFDQLINEYDRWVHIGWGPKNREEVIKATRIHTKQKPIYTRI